MAKFTMQSVLSFTIFSIFFTQFLIASIYGAHEPFGESLNPKMLGLKKKKLTRFVVYDHNIRTGTPTAFVIVPAPNTTGIPSNTAFRALTLVDNPLTTGLELNTTHVGRIQGLMAAAGKDEIALFSAFNMVFTVGKYNGSTISIYGRNNIMAPVREFPIIGGSGRFRFATGYAELRTAMYTPATGDATLQFTLYVLHY
ncbi:hypothetical protein ACHQM5_018623 [Ranunculus cassubicifolius]